MWLNNQGSGRSLFPGNILLKQPAERAGTGSNKEQERNTTQEGRQPMPGGERGRRGLTFQSPDPEPPGACGVGRMSSGLRWVDRNKIH
jgi:hypothetical protein